MFEKHLWKSDILSKDGLNVTTYVPEIYEIFQNNCSMKYLRTVFFFVVNLKGIILGSMLEDCFMFLCLSKEQKQKCYKKCSIRKGVFKNFTIITGKHLCLSLFYLKLQRTCNLIKRSANACF